MNDKRIPISEHLVELRARIIVCIVATLLAMIVAYVYCPDVFYPMMRAPLDAIQGDEATNPFVVKHPLLRRLAGHYEAAVRRAAKGDPTEQQLAPIRLKFTGLPVPFIMRLKVSLVVGMILALPLIAYQVWAFISAGLHAHERKYVLIFGPFSFLLFFFGAGVAYFLILPLGTAFLLIEGAKQGLDPLLTINEYAPFVMWLLLGFGIIFQMPLVALFLARIGMVGPHSLKRARRYAIVGMFVVGAVLTPPDPFTQIAMALPLIGLYEFSIVLSRLAWRKRRAVG